MTEVRSSEKEERAHMGDHEILYLTSETATDMRVGMIAKVEAVSVCAIMGRESNEVVPGRES